MRRMLLVPAFIAVALLGLLAFGRLLAVAQDDAAATAAHPAVGSWLLTDLASPDDPPTLVVFHSDGTYTQVEADGAVGVGTWEATGEQSLALTFVEQFGDEAEGVFTLTVRAAGEMDAGGDSFTATYTLELTQPDGTSQGEFGPGTVTATRIAVEPMGTPVGPLEELFGQFDEGTPEASPPAP